MADSGDLRYRGRAAAARFAPLSAADAAQRLLNEPGYTDDLFDYLAPLRHKWKLLAVVSAAAMLAGFAVSKYALRRWYQAIAIIKPMTPQQTAGHMQGLLNGANLGMLGDIVGSQYNSDAAQEYITILTSFSFVTSMVEQHHLKTEILPPSTLPLARDAGDWAVYRVMLSRFKCDYSVKNSSITLTFQDTGRDRAERILRYAIDDLREKLRSREVRNAADAVASLKEEVKEVPDALLVHQIYDLMATQIQRQHLAEIEADFAFVVLQPPVAPDQPVRPRILVNTLGAGLGALLLLSAYFILRAAVRGTSADPRKSSC